MPFLDLVCHVRNMENWTEQNVTFCSVQFPSNRMFFFYDFLTLTVPCDQIFALRPPIFL